MAQKFVICDGKLLMGNVSVHAQLVNSSSEAEKIVGGGYWYTNQETKTVYFYGSSQKYGTVTKEQFDSAVKQQSLNRFRIVFSESALLSKAIEEDNLKQ
jgi:hypothetical protein